MCRCMCVCLCVCTCVRVYLKWQWTHCDEMYREFCPPLDGWWQTVRTARRTGHAGGEWPFEHIPCSPSNPVPSLSFPHLPRLLVSSGCQFLNMLTVILLFVVKIPGGICVTYGTRYYRTKSSQNLIANPVLWPYRSKVSLLYASHKKGACPQIHVMTLLPFAIPIIKLLAILFMEVKTKSDIPSDFWNLSPCLIQIITFSLKT